MPEDETFLPAASPAEPAHVAPDEAVDGVTLRRQVLEIISDVLADSDPQKARARAQLHALLAAQPNEPEQALLQHLMASRNLTDDPHDDPSAAGSAWSVGGDHHATPQSLPVLVDRSGEKPIEAALDDRMLLTAFQPIRELPAGKVAGFEALARFVTGERASTDAWFQGAAAMGLGPDLEVAALHCALSAAGQIPPHLFVAFNLSPATCADPRVAPLLLEGSVAPDRIIVEIMGKIPAGELNALTDAMKSLRRRGLRLAVDGSGPAAVSAKQLLQLVPDIIKLDRNFLDSVLEPTEPTDPLPDMLDLARQAGAVLSAEGIESREQLAAAIDMGMVMGQGYLLGRPSVDPDDWSAWNAEADSSEVRHNP
ncbi:EAL domain-containing protein [Arthrobacter sp. ZGTC131]|uniref:EAL domain-containing protein n=1 Tax=Arthrobacter sp. ZGTC131 TaxID=2058898 RepID=UPI000CE54529|nr:EAL domain-containing protein [Arthrobacter sp. ZGTC131]